MKKIFSTLLISTLFLTGCFGSDNTPVVDGAPGGKLLYETAAYSIEVPSDWDILEKAQFTSNVPKGTDVAFRSNIKSEIFTANTNIVIAEAEEDVTALDFAKSSAERASTSLVDLSELTVTEKEDMALLQMKGKKSSSDPVVQFKQLYAKKGTQVFTVTASYLPDEDEMVVKYLDEMIDSFVLK